MSFSFLGNFDCLDKDPVNDYGLLLEGSLVYGHTSTIENKNRILYSNKYIRRCAMLAVNYTTMRNKLKDYCDLVTDQGETIIVTRKADRNVVVLSLEQYNAMEKEIRNAQYLAKLDRGFRQLEAGQGQIHELIED